MCLCNELWLPSVGISTDNQGLVTAPAAASGYLVLQRVKILLVCCEHLPPLSHLPFLPALGRICCFSTLDFRRCWWDSPQTSTLLSAVLRPPSPVPHQLLTSLAKFNTI